MTSPVEDCQPCQDRGLLTCSCDFYRDWLIYPPPHPSPIIRSGSYTKGYRDGHRVGYTLGHRDAQKENQVVRP